MEPNPSPDARALHADALVWDAHACLPLNPDADITALRRHKDAGVDYVSINIGMDMNPLEQVLTVLASFRAQLRAHPDLFVAVETTDDVRRAKREGRLAVSFDIEGGNLFCERPEMVQLFYDLGVRQAHLVYNRNNAIGGGCYDQDVPLTALGRRIVEAIHACGMLMDLSHTGYRTSLDIMALGLGPCVYSHANPIRMGGNKRNITDEQAKACVATGGIVCVNGVGRFLGAPSAPTTAILDAIEIFADLLGPQHVGLGIDYWYDLGLPEDPPGMDRAFWWPPEHGYGPGGVAEVKIAAPEQFPEITEGLLRRGWSEHDIRGVLGLNMLGLAERVWKAPQRLSSTTS